MGRFDYAHLTNSGLVPGLVSLHTGLAHYPLVPNLDDSAGLLTLGMLTQVVESNPDKLWTPIDSTAAEDRQACLRVTIAAEITGNALRVARFMSCSVPTRSRTCFPLQNAVLPPLFVCWGREFIEALFPGSAVTTVYLVAASSVQVRLQCM